MSDHTTTLSREDVAKLEIGHTEISRGMVWTLIAGFLTVIVFVPVVQFLKERPNSSAAEIAKAPRIAFDAIMTSKGSLWKRLNAGNRATLLHIQSYESSLEDESFLTKSLVPPTQLRLARYLGAGNEKAYVGRDGWLFYRPGVDYLTGLGFLDEKQLTRRAASGTETRPAPQPDPRKAILDFHEQLAARDIALVVMPIPVKLAAHPDRMSGRYRRDDGTRPLHNSSFSQFVDELRDQGVLVCDIDEVLASSSETSPFYLEADTHWRPETMAAAAERLSKFLKESVELPASQGTDLQRVPQEVTNLGDVAQMMKLPSRQDVFEPETVKTQCVLTSSGDYWHPEKSADVLLLGDSFCNIYSLESMDWGASAGLAEQLGFYLKRPIDVIARNDAGAFATCEVLSRDLARGKDRLAGKRVVIWEFVERELSVGDWKMLPMKLGVPAPSTFYTPSEGESVVVTGVVESMSHAPRPGSVPYKDHILTLHLRDLQAKDGIVSDGQAVVYLWSMRDNVWTDAARIREREQITLRLSSWYDVADKYEAVNRAELDDEELQFEDPCWGEFDE